jgi:hypothetical protein
VALFKRQDLIPLVGSLGIDAAISPRSCGQRDPRSTCAGRVSRCSSCRRARRRPGGGGQRNPAAVRSIEASCRTDASSARWSRGSDAHGGRRSRLAVGTQPARLPRRSRPWSASSIGSLARAAVVGGGRRVRRHHRPVDRRPPPDSPPSRLLPLGLLVALGLPRLFPAPLFTAIGPSPHAPLRTSV